MQKRTALPVLFLILALPALTHAADTVYLKPEEIAADIATLSPPPADGSPQQQGEIKTLLDWQQKRTPEEVTRAKSEIKVTGFIFADVLGDWFKPKSLPLTAKLLNDAYKDAKLASNTAKKQFGRKRPYQTDKQIQPVLDTEDEPSYPSGHATRGIVWATILSEMFPDEKEKLMARGQLIGEDRVIGGVHYPTDIEAGQKLGAQIAKQLLANAEFRAAMEKAEAECHAGAAVH